MVGPAQSLARSLHAEAKLVQQLGDILPVVADTEALLDEPTDHAGGPHPRAESCSFGSGLDQTPDFEQLLLGQPAGSAGGLARGQGRNPALGVGRDPAGHGRAVRLQLTRELGG